MTQPNSEDLVQRLRGLGERFGKCRDQAAVLEAADRILELEAENARLEQLEEALCMVVNADPGPEFQAAFSHARQLWVAYDTDRCAALTTKGDRS